MSKIRVSLETDEIDFLIDILENFDCLDNETCNQIDSLRRKFEHSIHYSFASRIEHKHGYIEAAEIGALELYKKMKAEAKI
ncbi:MAG: hypothetical protein JRN26_05540 [Nitrososphaerota archaeon]|jgi:hypothetical protein|nr:hypothetical protein [Nitrososphaerota archaeon]MDG6927188.1 hypothetical protein [Nitrososphaerota archaeon]MDG6930824.1 hypothetical protein [Nitrososphaerota archaeon]MDG6932268.1 hypothetical protein [Nitrososphaerota archaeon]MDG6936327.1 hypothetical protein [Nitrososphaerota archaeon]